MAIESGGLRRKGTASDGAGLDSTQSNPCATTQSTSTGFGASERAITKHATVMLWPLQGPPNSLETCNKASPKPEQFIPKPHTNPHDSDSYKPTTEPREALSNPCRTFEGTL